MNKPTLIVIDDDLRMAKSTAEIANLIGFNSAVTDNAEHVIKLADNKFYDVIISDLCMPEIDGIELINELSAKKIKSSLILMSGYSQEILETAKHFAEAKGLNLLGTLTKPFEFNEIKLILEKHFG